jgi:DNA polymerase III subunit delta
VTQVVEFARMEPNEARAFAMRLAAERGLKFGPGALDLLAESTAGDPARLASELDKMSLFFGGQGGTVRAEEIRALVPNSSEATIFALVDALAHRDRADSLELLDRLVREGEYLPLALTFLGGIFRLALVAREQNLRSAKDVMNHFKGSGAPMWYSRAEQIYTTSTRFSKGKLEEGIDLAFQADRALKSTRPDDRVVMEEFVLRLTAK